MFRYKKILNPAEKPPYGSIIDPAHPLSQGLAGCWLFNEGGGQKIFDLVSGIAADLTIQGTGGTHGWQGDGYYNAPSGDNGVFFNVGDISRFQGIGTGDYSLIFSGHCDNIPTNIAATAFTFNSYDPQWGIDYDGGLHIYDYTLVLSGPTSVEDTDFTISYVRRGTGSQDTKGFINGKLDVESAHVAALPNPTIVRIMWDNYTGEFFYGLMKHLVFYTKALTDSEVLQLYFEPYANILTPQYWYLCDFGAASSGTIKTIIDTGTGADSLENINVGLAISDTGAGADNLTGSAAFSVTDAGTGADSPAAVSVALTVQDTSDAADLISGILAAINISDTGSGIDAIAQIISSLLLSDTGAGIDSVSINTGATIKTVTDAGTGADSLGGLSVNLNINDAAAASDIIGQIIAGISVSDTAQAADIIEILKTALVTVTDTASGDDSVSVTASVIVSDIAAGLDIVKQVMAQAALTDAGSGADVIVRFSGFGNGRFKITFTGKKPDAAFTGKKPDAAFTGKKPGITFH